MTTEKKRYPKWIFGSIAAVLCVAALTCGLMVAFADKEGTADDPLIAKSYLDDVFTPEIMKLVDAAVAEVEKGYTGEIQTLIDEYAKKIDEKLAAVHAEAAGLASNEAFVKLLSQKLDEKLASVSVKPASAAETFKVVTLKSGQRITCAVGCEIMLRIGSAKAVGSVNPVLVDITQSTELKNGTALVKNHLYLVTIKDNGIQATANNTKVLIRGTYTIG